MSKVLRVVENREMAHIVQDENGKIYYVDTAWAFDSDMYELMAFPCKKNGNVSIRDWGRPVVTLTDSNYDRIKEMHEHVINHIEDFL